MLYSEEKAIAYHRRA